MRASSFCNTLMFLRKCIIFFRAPRIRYMGKGDRVATKFVVPHNPFVDHDPLSY